nr:MAG TPA: hypothetical protein [Caudoviricetes sp.]
MPPGSSVSGKKSAPSYLGQALRKIDRYLFSRRDKCPSI